MILAVDPEDGDGRHVVLVAHALGEADRGDRLQQREERSAEEAGLLPGDDGDRSRVAQLLGGGEGGRRRAATALLRGDDVGDARRASRGWRCARAIASRQAVRIRGIAGEEARQRA